MSDGPRQAPAILVTGASGMIGRLLVDALVDRGASLAVMLRPASDDAPVAGRAGVDVVRGDFDDTGSLADALAGVDRAFLLTNSSERTEAQQLAFAGAAASAGVSRIVKLSQLHASADSPVRFLRYHAVVEAAIRDTGIPFAFLRPNLILQAYLAFAPLIAGGQLQAPIRDARVSVVDARDIAAVAAEALLRDDETLAVWDVTGPEAVTHAELAEAIGAAAGHEVTFESVPADAFLAALRGFGMPQWQAEGSSRTTPTTTAVRRRPSRRMSKRSPGTPRGRRRSSHSTTRARSDRRDPAAARPSP